MTDQTEEAMVRALRICRAKNWSRDWSSGGCYLHLEASEFIEALRGKGDPLEEAGDVLFVFLAMLAEAGFRYEDVLAQTRQKMDSMEEGAARTKAFSEADLVRLEADLRRLGVNTINRADHLHRWSLTDLITDLRSDP